MAKGKEKSVGGSLSRSYGESNIKPIKKCNKECEYHNRKQWFHRSSKVGRGDAVEAHHKEKQ